MVQLSRGVPVYESLAGDCLCAAETRLYECCRTLSFQRGTRERERQADFLAAQVVEIADTVCEGKKVRISQKDGISGDKVDRSRRSRVFLTPLCRNLTQRLQELYKARS